MRTIPPPSCPRMIGNAPYDQQQARMRKVGHLTKSACNMRCSPRGPRRFECTHRCGKYLAR